MISVVIPVFNMQEFLPDTIDSVLSQTSPPDQIIIVDDGSTDHSLEIARKYEKDNELIKVISQTNRGLPSARNTGIMWATGEYILPLDSDDVLLPNCLEVLTNVIRETNADVISPSFKQFGISNENIILMPNPTVEDFKTANRIGYCSAIKTSVLREVGGYSSKMVWGAEDYALWFDLLKRGKKFVTIPQVLWLYRTKESSMWTETAKHYDEFMAQIIKDNKELFYG